MRILSSILWAFLFVTSASSQVFYGVTRNGGSNGGGTIFKMPADGSSHSVEYNFGFNGYVGRNFDYCQMVKAPNGKLYGVTPNGGQADQGVLFEFNPASNSYDVKYEFTNEMVGLNPFGSLVFGPNGNLYGTTNNGGLNWTGTIFEYIVGTNSVVKAADFHPDTGRGIYSGMVLAGDNMFYGAAAFGGPNDLGTLYQFDPSTFSLTKKHDFTGLANGSLPLRVPVLYNGKLYGAAFNGGAHGFGCLYEYDPSTDILTNAYDFTNTTDGNHPNATMTVVGSVLYGVTSEGGANNVGTIFEFNPANFALIKKEDFNFADTGKGDVNIMTLAPSGMLYGTSEFGGGSSGGTLFEFDPAIPFSLANLYSFTGGSGDGHTPKSGLTLANNGVFYGTTAGGGSNHAGVLFSFDPTATPNVSVLLQSNYSSEGAYPLTAPVQHPNGKLYGVTPYGGTDGAGLVYEFDPITKVYQVAYEFTGSIDGGNPEGSLALHPDGYLYGMAQNGGANSLGLIYQFDPSNFSVNTVIDMDGINTGARPHGSLTLANGIFYGVTAAGGLDDYGVLFNFDPGTMSYDPIISFGGNLGVAPRGELVQHPNGKLYGTAQFGGVNNKGVLFEYDPTSTSFSVVQHFGGIPATGAEPTGSLVLDDNGSLWGLTSLGGNFNAGTLFFHNPPVNGFGTMQNFDYGPTGGVPRGTLVKGAGDKLYGFTSHGGNGGWGVLFEYNPGSNNLQKKFDLTVASGATPMFGALAQVAIPPVISTVGPPSNPAGWPVVIFGANFSADPDENIVRFGPVQATVTFASVSQLQVVVPNGATYGPVTVTVGGLSGESPTPFIPTYTSNSWIPGSFSSSINLPGGTSNKRFVMADLDGDGRPDAIVADEAAGLVQVHQNISTTGSPSFDITVDVPICNGPYTLDVADMDGDGLLDIIAACSTGGVVAIIRNTSTVGIISFESALQWSFSTTCYSVVVADLDADGKQDVIAGGNGQLIRVYKNQSTPGTLDIIEAATLDVTPNSPGVILWDINATDVDGDAKVDIIVPVPDDPIGTSVVAIFRNTTTPGVLDGSSFTLALKQPVPGYTAGLDLADIDLDGMPELIVGSTIDFSPLTISKNVSSPGSVSFTSAVALPSELQVWEPKAADIDGDGRLDILAPHNGNGGVTIFKNGSVGGPLDPADFSLYTISTGGSPLNMELCDVDMDGLPDLLASNEASNLLQVFKNTNALPPPVITSVTPPYAEVGTSVVISGANFSMVTNNAVYFGPTHADVTNVSATSLTVTVPAGAALSPVAVTSNGLTAASSFPFTPDFTTTGVVDADFFATKLPLASGGAPQVLAVGDLNADGLIDLVVPNNGTANVSVIENQSVSVVPDFNLVNFSTLGSPIGSAIGDIDGDQQADFVVGADGGVSIFHHANTAGTLIDLTTFTKVDIGMPGSISGVALADLDGDGKLDIVAAQSGGTIYIARNHTTPDAIVPTDFDIMTLATQVPLSPTRISAGDLDGDKRPEIVVGYIEGSGTSTVISVFQNKSNPGGLLSSDFTQIDYAAGTRPISISLADVDSDGKLDILTANNTESSVSVLRNVISTPGPLSNGSFETAVSFTTGGNPLHVTSADVDGDLKPDILTSNDANGTVSILKNLISAPGSLTASSFQAKFDYDVGQGPESVAVADINGDGLPDIVATAEAGNTFAILYNIGQLEAPVISDIQGIGTTGFTLSWSEVTGAAEYLIDVSADNFASMATGYNGLSVASSPLIITGLPSGLEYKVRLRAANATGATPNSADQTVLLMPEAPANLGYISPGETSFIASWAAATGATGYLLDVSADDFASNLPAYDNLAVAGTSLAVTGLSPGVGYKFRVRTVNASYTSDNSGELFVLTVPSAPDATAATGVTTSTFTANWASTSPAAEYLLDVSALNDFSITLPGLNNLSLSVTFFDVSGLTAGNTYFYRIRAANGSGPSGYSDIGSVTIVPPGPNVTAMSDVGQTTFTVNWETAVGADDYRLDVSDDDFVTRLPGYDNKTVTGTSHIVTGVLPGRDYKVRMRASNGSGDSDFSNAVSVLTFPADPLANPATQVAITSFTANWDPVTTAFAYRLDVAEVSDFTTILAAYDDSQVSLPPVDVTGLAPGSTYFYRVRAVNASGTSGQSNTISATTLCEPPTGGVSTLIGKSSFTASWDATNGAVSYELDVSSDDFLSFLPGYQGIQLNDVTYTVMDLNSGTTYKWRVRAFNSAGLPSPNSNKVTVITLPTGPGAFDATDVTEFSFTANWGTSPGAFSYRLDVSADDTFTTRLSSYDDLVVFGTSEFVMGLAPGTTYYYRVRAVNDDGGASDNSNVKSVTLFPSAPGGLTSTAIGQTEFTANWNASTGATGYLLDVSVDNFVNKLPGYDNLQLTEFETSKTVTGLTAGTMYRFRVRAENITGASGNSLETPVTLVPPDPIGLAITSVNPTAFTATWTEATGATEYRLDVSDNNFISKLPGYDDAPVIIGNFLDVTGLTTGTDYQFRVRAKNASGTSFSSDPLSVTLVPATPGGLTATDVGQTTFTANWVPAPGAVGYRLDVSEDNFANDLPGYSNRSVSGISESVVGLTPGTDYKFRVRSENASGPSDNSSEMGVTMRPAAPSGVITIALSTTGFTASWNPAPGATGSLLDVSDNDFVDNLPSYNALPVSGNNYSVTGLTPGTIYKYRLRSENVSGPSFDYSSAVTVILVPLPPDGLYTTSIGQTVFVANWNAVPGATGYLLDVSDNNFTSYNLPNYDGLSVTPTNHTVTGLTAGTMYSFRVRALNGSDPSENSSEASVTLIPPNPDGLTTTAVSQTGFTANWNAATGATQYRLFVSNDNFATELPNYAGTTPVSGTSQVVTGLIAGTEYKFIVHAENPSGPSGDSGVGIVTLTPPSPVGLSATGITQTSFTANWAAALGATEYLLYVSEDGFASEVVGYSGLMVSGTSWEVTGLVAGRSYEFIVRASNVDGGNSDVSAPFMVHLKPGEPVAAEATGLGATSFTASWSHPEGADEFKLEVSDNNFVSNLSNYNNLVVTGTSQLVSGLTEGTTYKYRVTAVNATGQSGYSNQITVALVLTAPIATAATGIGQTSFTANWNSATSAEEYEVDVSADDFANKLPGYDGQVVTGTSLAVSGLTAGTPVKYRVRSKNSFGPSSDSNVIPVILIPATPTATTASGVTLTSFTANWNAANGATSYRVDVSGDDFVNFVPGHQDVSEPGLSHAVTGVASDVTYKYRVRAVNETGPSPSSDPITVVTNPTPTVASFTPLGGPPQTVVNVTGTNFTYPLNVSFNGGPPIQVLSGAVGSLSVTVPSGASTGKIAVTVEGQTGQSANNFIVDSTPPEIQLPSLPATLISTQYTLSVTITDNESQDNVQAKVYFRSVAGNDDFPTVPTTLQRLTTTTTYQATIPGAKVTESGVEYYVTANSYGGGSTSDAGTIRVAFINELGMSVPILDHGTAVTNYRIIAIPMDISTKTVAAVLEDDLNPSDRKNWRVSHFTPPSTTTELTSASTLDAGKGYWLIVKDQKSSFDTGPGTTVDVTRDIPFRITLKPGWNQIGNPYNFNIKWQDVINANSTISASFTNQVRAYRGGWGDQDGLDKLEGGFIKNTSSFDIIIKIPAQRPTGRGQDVEVKRPLDDESWKVEFTLRQGDFFNAISGFGMNLESSEGKDRYDAFTMPRFFDEYIEINHTRKSDDDQISLDVVPTVGSYVWEFDVESNLEDDHMILEWDNSYFGDNNKGLVLWDEQLKFGINMRLSNRYEFLRSESRRFKVFFGESEEVADKAAAAHLVLHNVFPNPTEGEVKVAFSVPSAGEVTFDVYDLLGRKVWSDAANFAKGYHEVDLTGRFTAGQGMVIVQVGMDGELQQKRLVIK